MRQYPHRRYFPKMSGYSGMGNAPPRGGVRKQPAGGFAGHRSLGLCKKVFYGASRRMMF
jgi:hypothetical protein